MSSLWFEKLINKIKEFFDSYDAEEIIMYVFFGFIIILLLIALIGLFVALFNCTV